MCFNWMWKHPMILEHQSLHPDIICSPTVTRISTSASASTDCPKQFVLSIAWLCSDLNKQQPWPLKLILAQPTATGNPTQRRPAQAKVRVHADVVVRTETIELPLWQDHLVVWNGRDIRHCVALVVVNFPLLFTRMSLLLIPFTLAGLLSKRTHLSAGLTAMVSPPHSTHLAKSMFLLLSTTSGIMMQHMHCWQ